MGDDIPYMTQAFPKSIGVAPYGYHSPFWADAACRFWRKHLEGIGCHLSLGAGLCIWEILCRASTHSLVQCQDHLIFVEAFERGIPKPRVLFQLFHLSNGQIHIIGKNKFAFGLVFGFVFSQKVIPNKTTTTKPLSGLVVLEQDRCGMFGVLFVSLCLFSKICKVPLTNISRAAAFIHRFCGGWTAKN